MTDLTDFSTGRVISTLMLNNIMIMESKILKSANCVLRIKGLHLGTRYRNSFRCHQDFFQISRSIYFAKTDRFDRFLDWTSDFNAEI